MLFGGCLTASQHADVSQMDMLRQLYMLHDIGAADSTFYLTQPQRTDTGPTSPSADPIMPDRVATWEPILKSLVWYDLGKDPQSLVWYHLGKDPQSLVWYDLGKDPQSLVWYDLGKDPQSLVWYDLGKDPQSLVWYDLGKDPQSLVWYHLGKDPQSLVRYHLGKDPQWKPESNPGVLLSRQTAHHQTNKTVTYAVGWLLNIPATC